MMSGDSGFGGIGGMSDGIPGECARNSCVCMLPAQAFIGRPCALSQVISCKPRWVKSSRYAPKHELAAAISHSLLPRLAAAARRHAPIACTTSTTSLLLVTLSSHTRSNSTTRPLSASEPWMACAAAKSSNS